MSNVRHFFHVTLIRLVMFEPFKTSKATGNSMLPGWAGLGWVELEELVGAKSWARIRGRELVGAN